MKLGKSQRKRPRERRRGREGRGGEGGRSDRSTRNDEGEERRRAPKRKGKQRKGWWGVQRKYTNIVFKNTLKALGGRTNKHMTT